MQAMKIIKKCFKICIIFYFDSLKKRFTQNRQIYLQGAMFVADFGYYITDCFQAAISFGFATGVNSVFIMLTGENFTYFLAISSIS